MIWVNEQLMVINVKLVIVMCKHVHSFHAAVLQYVALAINSAAFYY